MVVMNSARRSSELCIAVGSSVSRSLRTGPCTGHKLGACRVLPRPHISRGALGSQLLEEQPAESYVFDPEYSIVPSQVPEENIKYFGSSDVEGVPILDAPGGEVADRLMPGDIVAAEVCAETGHARLLDGRGYLLQLQEGLEEVHPWAAQVMKKPGVTKNDAASLAYLSPDLDSLTPLAEHLPLPDRVLANLKERGITSASPIQEAVFDRVHRGESLCLQSQTGSGKTLAMVLPLLSAMAEESEWGQDGDKIVVVTSCRELAVQLFAEIESTGFFPAKQGYSTMVIVGNVPPSSAVLGANIIIGTPNELGGLLHKDVDIIKQINTQLRAIVMDEVDEYTTAPRLYASKWAIKKKRRVYNEQKMTLCNQRGDFDTGKIEWFVKRCLSFSRRKDLQVLAASATLSRNMARKVHRLLRWDPLGRWYNKPPPLMRPLAAMKADWQSIPRMPTVPLHVAHRFVPVLKAPTDFNVTSKHYTRKAYNRGGLPRLRIRAAAGQKRGLFGQGGRPVTKELAASLLDGLHDTLRSRESGSSLVIVCRSVGMTVRETVRRLRRWGMHEVEAMHEALWTDPRDWVSRWAIKYSHDGRDHAPEIAERHRELNERLKAGRHRTVLVGSKEWKMMQWRKKEGETTSPIVVGFEGIGRGLHFDGVDTVYILGLPRKPEIYMHLAGRVGRLGQKAGKVVSVLPKRGSKVLDAWSLQLGPGVKFEEEPIARVRSAPVDVVSQRLGRALHKERRRLRRLRREEEEESRHQDVPLLPETEDYVPVPGDRDSQGDAAAGRERMPEPAFADWEMDERGNERTGQ